MSRLCPRQCIRIHGQPASRDHPGHVRIGEAAGDVVDDPGTGGQRRLGHRGPVGVHADRHARRGQRPDHRQHPAGLLLGRPGRRRAGSTRRRRRSVSAPSSRTSRARARPRRPGRRSGRRRRTSPGVTLSTPITHAAGPGRRQPGRTGWRVASRSSTQDEAHRLGPGARARSERCRGPPRSRCGRRACGRRASPCTGARPRPPRSPRAGSSRRITASATCGGQPLLHLRPLGVQVDQPGQLATAR